MIVRRARKHSNVVGGGGAAEMEVSKFLREHSRSIQGKQQLIINAYAKAFEIIPALISENAGFDSTDILNKLRQKHAQGGTWFGVDIEKEGICDTFESFVWEPTLVKTNAVVAATEACCMILSVDVTIKAESSQQEQQQQMAGAGRGRGMPMRGGMRR